ncbi:MAG: 4Fe-4S dicluster domain-containing protein [Saprospirales bacterium]|nr:MAG: 4Fe-4S dicluster domain-containing protein [Saprospirales bacterium]
MKEFNSEVWVGTEEVNNPQRLKESSSEEFFEAPVLNDLSKEEVVESEDNGASRRDFLKYLGFGLGAATIAAGCEAPVRRALPYLVQPDAIVPGVATYYSSNFVKGSDFCPVIVKTREGRPIKIEGNPLSGYANGGTSARAQASVLELYDSSRLRYPGKVKEEGGVEKMSWEEIDEMIVGKLNESSNVRILSNSIHSPSTLKVIEDFKERFPNTAHIEYDPVSLSALIEAHESAFGVRAIPTFDFKKAKVVVSLNADFLGTWLSPVQFANQWAANRKIRRVENAEMNRVIAIEPHFSLTGSNADNRVLVRPSEMGLATAKLHNEVAALTNSGGAVSVSGAFKNPKAENGIKRAAANLVDAHRNGNKTLVVCGTNSLAEQLMVIRLNQMLGNYGETLDIAQPMYLKRGVDRDVVQLMEDMEAGNVDALFVLNDANPVYDLPEGDRFKNAMRGVDLTLSTSTLPNETVAASKYSCPSNHLLESWGDVNPMHGYFGIVQPTIHPLFDTRESEESLLRWSDSMPEMVGPGRAFYHYIRKHWEDEVFPKQSRFAGFDRFWDHCLHNGFAQLELDAVDTPNNNDGGLIDVSGSGREITSPSSSDLELSFYEAVHVGSGQYANNPWLQEMPDPLLRTVWDSCLSIGVEWDGRNTIKGFRGFTDGQKADLTIGGQTFELPVVTQFGLMDGQLAFPVGYGRTVSGPAGTGVGTNIFPTLWRDNNGNIQYYASQVDLSNPKGEDRTFASVQYHHTFGVSDTDPRSGEEINVDEQSIVNLGAGFQGALTRRTIIRRANLPNLKEAVEDLQEERKHHQYLNAAGLYPGFDDLYKNGHHWGMTVDMSSCIGCGACQVACMAENNVPIVGKNEVRRHHEMTWLRIDRYYYGDFDNPNVVYQPMMCQHCDNAPCENVCPVGATNHSSEGLNQMTYNRCIGTRYCANNCPYKVRRFNWFDYTAADMFPVNENNPFGTEVPFYGDNLTRMVLNPDVTVRTRGVIEKCSFCVQRIQEGKLKAKNERRALRDGDIKTACVSACPTGAIQFGDMNDKESKVSKDKESPLNFYVLEEVNVQSSVGYLMKVINKDENINKEA